MPAERRRLPGTVGYLWCRACRARFAIAGRAAGETTIELIACPECHALRRMVLPAGIVAPFRVLTSRDRIRAGPLHPASGRR